MQASQNDFDEDQNGGQLHDVIIGSDDEMESVLSGPLSDQGDNARESSSLLEDINRPAAASDR